MLGIDCGQLSIDQLHYGVPSKWDSGPANISEFISVKGSIHNALKALFGLCLPLEYLCPGSSADLSGTTGTMWRPEYNEFTNCIYCMFTESFSIELGVLIVGGSLCSAQTLQWFHRAGAAQHRHQTLYKQHATLLHISFHMPRNHALFPHERHTLAHTAQLLRWDIILSWCACWATRCIFPRRSISSNPDSVRGWCFPQGYAHRWGATHPVRWREQGCHISDDTKSCSFFVLLFLPCLLTATGWHNYLCGIFFTSD